MNTIQKIEVWGDTHHPRWLDIIRIPFGIFLLYKGIYFIQNTDAILALIESPDGAFLAFSIAHYVAFAHLVGGLLITLGMFTRMACMFQIPVLLGAVFYINLSKGIFNSEFEISLLVLILLIVFLVLGSGKISVDNYIVND